MVQNQYIGTGIQHRRDVGREIGRGERRAHVVDGFPAHGFGRGLNGFLLRPAPCVVGCQTIDLTVVAIEVLQHRSERRSGHVSVKEVAEAVGFFIFTGGVVGVGQTRHKDHAGLLAQALNSNSHTGRRATGDHDRAVFLDHRLRRCAGRVRFRLRVAGDELDLLAHDPVTFQRLGAEGVQHAAVALTVQVFDRQLERAQFVCALVRVGARLWHVKAQRHRVARWRVRETGMRGSA